LLYFDFIDYIILNPVIASPVSGFLKIMKNSVIYLDVSWKNALLNYSNLENGRYGKEVV
jgi:hypothetical protein